VCVKEIYRFESARICNITWAKHQHEIVSVVFSVDRRQEASDITGTTLDCYLCIEWDSSVDLSTYCHTCIYILVTVCIRLFYPV